MLSPPPGERLSELNQVLASLEIGSYSAEILSWGFIGPTYWRNYLHSHSFFEVCYAFAGRGSFWIEDRDHPVRSGDLFVARPGEVHEILSSEVDPLGICFWSFTLQSARDHLPTSAGTDLLLSAFRSGSPWVSNRVGDVPMTLQLLEGEIALRHAGYVEAIRSLTCKLLLDTCRAVVEIEIPPEEMPAARPTPAQRTVEQIVRYLSDNLSRPVTVRDVAAQVSLSERHTNRLFRSILGVSIVEYLTSLRMEVASQLLLARELPIKEVAREVGYADVQYFTTLFHRRTGMPPAAFRSGGGTRRVENISTSST